MFKKAVWVILQTLLFLALSLAGLVLPVVHVLPMWRVAVGTTHWLVLDGIVLLVAAWLVILGIEAAAKRLRTAGPLTSLAAVLALALGMAMKFGFMDRLAGQ